MSFDHPKDHLTSTRFSLGRCEELCFLVFFSKAAKLEQRHWILRGMTTQTFSLFPRTLKNTFYDNFGLSKLVFIFFLLFLVCVSCVGKNNKSFSDNSTTTIVSENQKGKDTCKKPDKESGESHQILSILVNGNDVGREVRTYFSNMHEKNGLSRISTIVRRLRYGTYFYDTYYITMENLDNSRRFIGGSQISINEEGILHVVLSFGDNTDGVIERRILQGGSKFNNKAITGKITLSGSVITATDLRSYLSKTALGKIKAPWELAYFDPEHLDVVEFIVKIPEKGNFSIAGQSISGYFVDVVLKDSSRKILSIFCDTNGKIWREEYPIIPETRLFHPGVLTIPENSAEYSVDLVSRAYLGNPNNATFAIYFLEGPVKKLKLLNSLGIPGNQKLDKINSKKYKLSVLSKAPDGSALPEKSDLADTKYINSASIEIKSALKYLLSAGKKGNLPEKRRYNVTGIIARSNLIEEKNFWASPGKTAGMIMEYVDALIPYKKRVSMADAVSVLVNGSGDCTEHAVLFAALMRAHKIPTRLISGLYLKQGGVWEYHMWNEYWNDEKWVTIDPLTGAYHPGATYIAIGNPVSYFEKARPDLDVFINSTFKGVKLNLIEAYSSGEKLSLAIPNDKGKNQSKSHLFNAYFLSKRGDHKAAVSLIDKKISSNRRSLEIKLAYIDFLVHAGQNQTALEKIYKLRKETSQKSNLKAMDELEFRALLNLKMYDKAEKLKDRLKSNLDKSDKISRIILESQYTFGLNEKYKAILMTWNEWKKFPDNANLCHVFASQVSKAYLDAKGIFVPSGKLLKSAVKAALKTAMSTGFADARALYHYSSLLMASGDLNKARWILDHALVLSPLDKDILNLSQRIDFFSCK